MNRFGLPAGPSRRGRGCWPVLNVLSHAAWARRWGRPNRVASSIGTTTRPAGRPPS